MNHLTISLGFFTGLLQLIVAAYALRLNWLFGTARVGWSLCGAFSLMAFLHWVQSLPPLNPGAGAGIKVELIYACIALLLFVSLMHLETTLKEKMLAELKGRQIRAELESDVEKKSTYLMKAIEQLQAEMEERKRMEAEVECLNLFKPGLFDCFAAMIKEIPATAIARTLARESYMLEVDLACQRPISTSEAGSILTFAHFVGTCGQGKSTLAAVTLPPTQVAFYQRTVERLIQAGELPPAARSEFEKTFTASVQKPDNRQKLLPRLNRPADAGNPDWFSMNAGRIPTDRVATALGI